MDELQRTSERVVEGRGNAALYEKHAATYRWAISESAGLDVLDYGCGTGYGASMAAAVARSVVGVDVDAAVIRYATGRYQTPNLRFEVVQGPLPFNDGSFDAVLSFQVLEHVDPDPYLSEIRRLLRPGGRVFLATPNRRGRLFKYQKPWNPWHLTEYHLEGLRDLLEGHFDDVRLFELVGVSEAELRRQRRNRLISLPLTLPVVPAVIRRSSLRFVSRLKPDDQISEPTSGTRLRVVSAPATSPSSDLLAIAASSA